MPCTRNSPMSKGVAGTGSAGNFLRPMRWSMLGVVAVAWLSMTTPCAAAVNPDSANFYDDARLYIKKGDIKAAVIQLRNAIRADENNIEARFDLAGIYLSHFDGPDAEKELRAALAHGMSRERVLLPLAQALILQNNAAALLKEIDPDIVRGHDAAVLHDVRARAYLILRQ